MLDYDIVLPFYNQADFLGSAIESALGQTIEPRKILLIDDCSTDASNKIAKKYVAEFSKVELYRTPRNFGVSYARNHALSISESSIIIFFDSDDISTPTRAENHLKLHAAGADLVYVSSKKQYGNSYTRTYKNKCFDGQISLENAIKMQILGKRNLEKNSGPNYIPASTLSILREAFIQLHGFDENLKRLEDIDLFLKACEAGKHLSFSDEINVLRIHSENETKSNSVEHMSQIQLIKKWSDFVDKKHLNEILTWEAIKNLYFEKKFYLVAKLIFQNLTSIFIMSKILRTALKRLIHDSKIFLSLGPKSD